MKIGRNDPCWCGSGKKYKVCHADFDEKLAELKSKGEKVPRTFPEQKGNGKETE